MIVEYSFIIGRAHSFERFLKRALSKAQTQSPRLARPFKSLGYTLGCLNHKLGEIVDEKERAFLLKDPKLNKSADDTEYNTLPQKILQLSLTVGVAAASAYIIWTTFDIG